MKKFNISGMSCAACSARVEKVVSAVSDVESCSVNLLTNSMTVEGSADTETIIAAVEAAGYGASLDDAQNELSARRASGAEKEEKSLLRMQQALLLDIQALDDFLQGVGAGLQLYNFLIGELYGQLATDTVGSDQGHNT